jgi:hypothetical protein
MVDVEYPSSPERDVEGLAPMEGVEFLSVPGVYMDTMIRDYSPDMDVCAPVAASAPMGLPPSLPLAAPPILPAVPSLPVVPSLPAVVPALPVVPPSLPVVLPSVSEAGPSTKSYRQRY